ncbi:hypothetical protein [Mucilaginibacter straminoryzae]|nr:hypothetical protein [Mucilaginibacter straminoryzae]
MATTKNANHGKENNKKMMDNKDEKKSENKSHNKSSSSSKSHK